VALQTTGSSGLTAEMKTYYDRTLLIRTTPVLLYTKFAQHRSIPKHGGKTIEFRKFAPLTPQTDPLVEGVLYTDLKDLSVSTVEATIAAYGNALGFADLVSTTTFDPILTETTELLAENAAETLDELHRDVLALGTTVQYAANRAGRSSITAADTMTVAEIREAVLTLKLNRARKIGGFYHAIIHPRTFYDIQGTTEWVTANNEQNTGRVFDGSLGTLYGVKFWETDKALVYENAGSGSTVDVFATLFFGADAYGSVKLAGRNLRTIYKALGSAGTMDPTDEQQTMAWKAYMVCVILDDAFMLRLEHATSTATNV
jgi:N4-gp56 family major capsid protein